MDWNGLMMGEAKKWQLLLMIGRVIIVRVRGFGGWMEAALPQMGFEFERYQLKLKHKCVKVENPNCKIFNIKRLTHLHDGLPRESRKNVECFASVI